MSFLPDSAKMLRDLRNGFITGVAVLSPLVITIFLVNFLVNQIGEPTSNVLFQHFKDIRTEGSLTWYVFNILATIVVFVFITGIGFFSRYLLGKFVLRSGERIINAVPLVSTVYKTVKQIVDTFSEQQKAIFQKVVLIEYPKLGTYAVAFLTSDARGEIQAKTGKDVVNVFVPTTPNPTSGFLLMVPREEVIDLEMTIADGMKLIISGGAVSPPYPKPPPIEKPAKNGNRSLFGGIGRAEEAP